MRSADNYVSGTGVLVVGSNCDDKRSEARVRNPTAVAVFGALDPNVVVVGVATVARDLQAIMLSTKAMS